MWKIKILIQFVLAHLPWGEELNFLLQLKSGSHSPEKTTEHIIRLAEKVRLACEHVTIEGSAVLEIGTGWDAITAILFYIQGAKCCYTFDHQPHVRFSLVLQVINQIEKNIEEIHSITSIPTAIIKGKLKQLKKAKSLVELFDSANIFYFAPGDACKTGLPNGSVDLIFAYAVFEHIPETVINDILIESKRILKQNGIAYFGIGLHDHYAGFDKMISKVNFLQYPEWLWAFFVKNKISYHNRLREKEFIDIFHSHQAKIKWKRRKIDPSDVETLKTMNIDPRFSSMSNEDLAVYYTEVILSF
ncbi:MAG: methyltransferase domain-containing protein [bacterium]